MKLPIRIRLTLAYALTAALVSSLGAAIFSDKVHEALIGSVDAELRASAGPVVAGVEERPPIPGSASPRQPLVQVFDPGGSAVESSSALHGRDLLSAEQRRAVRTGDQSFTVRLQDDTRVLAIAVTRPDGTWLVVVGSSLQPQDAVVADVTGDLLLGATAITLFGTLGAWLLAGAALRPVERMRREAAQLSERDPALSLTVPPTRDELTALATTMNDLLGRIGEGMRRERRLVSDAAHELRTPLSILRTELELAGRPGRSREELAEAVTSSSSEVNRLVRLADDLLLLARSDEGIPLDRGPDQAVAPIVVQAARAVAATAAARSVEILVDAPHLTAEVDPGRLRQAVDNLLSNALRHAPAGSQVRVSARQDAGALVIEVSDRGPGFPADFLPHAFDRFSRADSGRTRETGGSGLGLAVVRAIASAHGGRALVANTAQGGAMVRMVIPMRDSRAAE